MKGRTAPFFVGTLGASLGAIVSLLASAGFAVEEAAKMTRQVDAMLEEQWMAAGIEPADRASDGEFLRRASLDLTGVAPRVSRVREFLEDNRPDKYAHLVDELVASSRYATHMADVWTHRILPSGADEMHAREAQGLNAWLRERFGANLRYDNLVSGLLLTSGDDELGPGLYYRTQDLAPEKLAASTAEIFLGVTLQCAQCHDHPQAPWSQRDFWGLAAFFAQVASANDGRKESSLRLVDRTEGEVTLPNSDETVSPRYLRGDVALADVRQTRREQLAFWLAARDNPWLRRAAVNWAWSHLFAEPLVQSVDLGIDASTSPREKILGDLAQFFVASGFDLRQLLGVLAKTRAYQLSSRMNAGSSTPATLAAAEWFASMRKKSLSPEQLYECFQALAPQAIAIETTATPANAAVEGLANIDVQRADFVRRMRSPPGDPADYRGGTLQALLLMNGPTTLRATEPDGKFLRALEAPFFSDEERIEMIFLATLSRLPEPDERAGCLYALAGELTVDERRRVWSDVLWATLNSAEFAFSP